jgi:nitrate/nitrite transporter NarK
MWCHALDRSRHSDLVMQLNRWTILGLLFAVRTGMGLQYQTVAALSPMFMTDYSISVADIGLLIGLYHAPGSVLAFPGGAIAARVGDKRVVLIGIALMIAGGLMMVLASTWPLQIAARLVAGAGGILLNVLMSKMVTDWFAGKEIDTAMAVFGNAAPVGIALALILLPLIAGAGGRIAALWVVEAYLFAAILAMAFLYRAPQQSGHAASGQSIWPVRRALSAVLAAGLIYGLWNASFVAVIGFGPLMLTERGWTMAAASSTTSLVVWLVALSLPLGGWLSDRTGRSSLILVGGLMAFAVALALSSRVDGVTPAFILLGIVCGLPCGPIMGLPARVLAVETRSVGMGAFFTVYYVLQVAGPWLVGELAKMSGSSQTALDAGVIFLCVGFIIWLLFRQLANGSRLRPAVLSASSG